MKNLKKYWVVSLKTDKKINNIEKLWKMKYNKKWIWKVVKYSGKIAKYRKGRTVIEHGGKVERNKILCIINNNANGKILKNAKKFERSC